MQNKLNKGLLCRLCSVFVVLALVFGLCACDSTQTVKKFSVPATSVAEGCIAAQNDNFTLTWDADMYALLLRDNKSGKIWSTVPYDFYLKGEGNVNLSSPIFIEYYSPEDGSLQTAKAYSDCMQEGNFSVKTIKNGIRMSFWFLDAEAIVSVDFVLRDDSLEVSIPFDKIMESGKTKLTSISLLPYFCAVPNTTEKSSYLFVPSGSGALMYTDEDVQNVSRSFVGDVYGSDAAGVKLDNTDDETAINVPVYGATAGDNSLMAIIKQGDSIARINAEAGNFRNGYSTVYSTAVLRGYDLTEAERNNYTDVEVFAETYDKKTAYTVGFYPLSGDKSGYNGMAVRYKEYLDDSGTLHDDTETRADYHINFLGGAMTKKFFLGFPYMSLTAATDFDGAESVLKEMLKISDTVPEVTLTGFGASGVDAGEIAGGLGFAKALGGKKGYEKFEKYCDSNGIGLFVDFDAVRFSKSGNGVSKSFDTAKTPGRRAAAFYPRTVGTRVADESFDKIRLLKRSELNVVFDKILDFTKDFKSGISLSTLSNTAYSDYAESEYFVKGNMAKQVSELLLNAKKSGTRLAGMRANGYAAAASDMVYNAPTDNGGYLNLDTSVPFYSLVFGQGTALYCAPLNLADDTESLVLSAVESGVLPSFTLVAEYDEKLTDSSCFDFYGTDFDGQKAGIKDILDRLYDYRQIAKDQYVTGHTVLGDGLAKTVFSSGAAVIVNHNDFDTAVDGTAVKAKDFVIIK